MTNYLIVTGGSRGIGRAIAGHFYDQSWQVVNFSRRACDLPKAANILVDFKEKNWHADIQDVIKKLFSNVEKICLVHNAAISYNDTIQNLSIEQLQVALQVNLFTPLLLNQLFLPFMEAESSIIYIGSTLAEKAVPGSASYIMTKHAIAGAMKATCQDLLTNPNVHTCCICPGFTETEMLKSIFSEPEHLEMLYGRVSKKRLIQPDEIAALVYFCAHNPVINGSMIHANLGQIEK